MTPVLDPDLNYSDAYIHRLQQRDGLTRDQIAERLGLTFNEVKWSLQQYRAGNARPGFDPEQTRNPDEADTLWVEAWKQWESARSDNEPESARETMDRLLGMASEMQREIDRLDPVITHATIDLPGDQPVAILMAGCMQMGGRWTAHSLIRNSIDQLLALPNIYFGLFGDEVEGFDLSTQWAGARSILQQALPPEMQLELWRAYFDQVKARTLWGCASQHGTHWKEKTGSGLNAIKRSYLDARVPFFDGQGYVKIKVGAQAYNFAVAHEFPGSSMYNQNHSQKRALWQRFPNSDVVAQADKHNYAYTVQTHYGNEYTAGHRGAPMVHLIQIGTAKIGPDPYTIRGWERGAFGWPYVVLWPDKHQVRVSRDPADVAHWLTRAAPMQLVA